MFNNEVHFNLLMKLNLADLDRLSGEQIQELFRGMAHVLNVGKEQVHLEVGEQAAGAPK